MESKQIHFLTPKDRQRALIKELCRASKEVGTLLRSEVSMMVIYEEAENRPDVVKAKAALSRMDKAIGRLTK